MNFPAFKDWQVIIEALGQGSQILILRKGGIAEGKKGFQVEHQRFWLFPTQYHQQLEKTKPAAAGFAQPAETSIPIRYFADVAAFAYLDRWDPVEKLDAFHFWKMDILRERFDFSRHAGIHLLILRVHQLSQPIHLEPSASYEGCKSWIEIPVDWNQQAASPVLDDAAFQQKWDEVKRVLESEEIEIKS